MHTDTILLSVIDQIDKNSIPARDYRILKSLTKNISGSRYLTENQSRLLIKIVTENIQYMKTINDEIDFLIKNPSWSKEFHVPTITKKFYITQDEGDPLLCVEFLIDDTFPLKKRISVIAENVESFRESPNNNKLFYANLTEKNIVILYERLSQLNFDIDNSIVQFYKTIKSWSEDEIKNQFKINTISNSKFKEKLATELGLNTPLTENIIADRSIRYQYFVPKKKDLSSLTEKIAYRDNKNIWINNQSHQLKDVLLSLIDLKRLPVLFVFDLDNCYTQLLEVHKAVTECKINSGIGIYFRVNNSTKNKNFNTFIAEQQYNSHLDETINIVGIPNGKIPKFFLKNSWQPMSVISLDNSLKTNKTSVYLNCCDLIISYSKDKQLIKSVLKWA